MHLFILGPNFTDKTAICDLGSLRDFVTVDGETSVSYLYLPYYLEKASDIVGHALASFKFMRDLHEVLLFLVLPRFGSDDCVFPSWL